ncbi:MAG: SDR family NAD(P)-dependent oxidoreductase [Balneolaceae bacterium]|nr:SDR family NAD(P)-dependent oxidoreductase [Balneolaceae bacterium]
MNRLKDKWILITGATSGIGKASAELFAESGTNLIITGRREERLKSIQKNLQSQHDIEVEIFSFDVRDRDACKACVDAIDHPIDILLNNAGLASGKDSIDEADFDDWDAMIDTNVKGLLSMTRFVSERMKERDKGHIINIGSIAGHEAYPGGSVYCGTKHAVKAITEAAKMDLTGTNIRVSAVSPGLVDTEFSEVRFHGDEEQAQKVYKDMTPLTGRDIAEIIHFVANRPPHVNIMDTIVFPVHQSSARIVARPE